MNNSIEKKAMTESEKAKYIKAAIVAGIGSAGIGAIVRNIRAQKERTKAHDAAKSKTAIIVPIKKTKFMEGLPTPEELAKSRGETVAAPDQIAKADTPALPSTEQAVTPAAELTPEQIAAKKKEILRANAHKFDFFGKAAAAKKAEEEKPEENAETKDDGKKTETSEASDLNAKKEERILLRDQDGKFVSPTDPVGVAQEEKRADGVLSEVASTIAHPIDSAKMIWNAATDKPIWFTAGALGSVYLAAKISDAINERRRERAKERLEGARAEYVNLLEGEEKKAGDNSLRNGAGMMLGGAFFIPMALSALVTNKIIENRKIDKKREKEMADSYPDDPVIMYKTSEAKEIPMSPETAIAFMALNREIMKCAEVERAEFGLCKVAQEADKSVVDAMASMLADPANNADLLGLTKGYYNNDEKAQNAALHNMVGRYASVAGIDLDGIMGGKLKPRDIIKMLGKMDMAKAQNLIGLYQSYNNPAMRAALKNQIMTDPRTRAIFVDRFNNDAEFGKFKGEILNKELANSWVGRTFKQDGLLYRGIRWLFNKLGIGNRMFNERLNGLFAAKPNQSAQAAAGAAQKTVSAPSQTTSNTTPAASQDAVTPAAPAAPAAKPIPAPSANDPKYGGKNGVELWKKDYAAWHNQEKQ